jgi:hypothetical protein
MTGTERAEVERLREALRRVLAAALVNLANAEKEIADLRALLAAQEARAQRVEAALRRIAGTPRVDMEWVEHAVWMRDVARAALSQPAATGEGT